MTPAVRLDRLSLTLGGGDAKVDILKSVSLAIEAGRSTAILGPSGSGKSSLLMVMTGLERPTSGSVTVAGTELTRLGEDDLARFRGRHVGIVFQSFHLIPTMTALENVAVPLDLAGAADAMARARAELTAVGLAHRLNHHPATLSGGEQQRVAIARARIARPAILVADEPTGNLDAGTGADIAEMLLAEPKARGTTLILVTHDERLAARCDAVVRMDSGRIVETSAA